jgi:hypothetical protein
MATIQPIEGIVEGIVKPPPKKDNDRYYKCQLYMTGINCKRIKHQETKTESMNTKVLSVKSYIPECFDKYILKYKCTQKWISIENNEPKTK